MKDVKRVERAGFSPAAAGQGGRAWGSRCSRGDFAGFFFFEGGGNFLCFGSQRLPGSAGCREGIWTERGGTKTWQSARGSYKGKGSSPGVIWIRFQDRAGV